MLAEQTCELAPSEWHPTHAALPPVLTCFFGRQQESVHLVDLLSRRNVKLVTLAGPVGVGKTRLAIEQSALHVIRSLDFQDAPRKHRRVRACHPMLQLMGSSDVQRSIKC
jgi:ATP-dependent Clp protease ATP-binding subunit ClpA